MARILYTLETIGRAHQQGGIQVSNTLPFGQQCEVRAVLDELARFSERQHDEHPS